MKSHPVVLNIDLISYGEQHKRRRPFFQKPRYLGMFLFSIFLVVTVAIILIVSVVPAPPSHLVNVVLVVIIAPPKLSIVLINIDCGGN